MIETGCASYPNKTKLIDKKRCEMSIHYIDPIKLKFPEQRPNVLLFGNGFFL